MVPRRHRRAILASVSSASPARITYLGHSTVLVELDGLRVLTDPILRTRVGPLVRAHPPVERSHWTDIDAALISHSHWDHLDVGSLRLLGPGVPIVCPAGLGARLRARGFRHVEELEPGGQARVGSVGLEATHAEHRGFGPPIGGTERAIGFLLCGSRGVYFAGDTALFAGMRLLAGRVDVALLPVWGWGPRAGAGDHLDPMGAARALSLIRPPIAVPIHWGTLHPVGMRWLRPATRVDPPHQFARLARLHAPGTTVRVLPIGSSFDLPAAAAEELVDAAPAGDDA
jgi:L-ascorbate metabolism protein UlaG (beta-lactamase superfamily)